MGKGLRTRIRDCKHRRRRRRRGLLGNKPRKPAGPWQEAGHVSPGSQSCQSLPFSQNGADFPRAARKGVASAGLIDPGRVQEELGSGTFACKCIQKHPEGGGEAWPLMGITWGGYKTPPPGPSLTHARTHAHSERGAGAWAPLSARAPLPAACGLGARPPQPSEPYPSCRWRASPSVCLKSQRL